MTGLDRLGILDHDSDVASSKQIAEQLREAIISGQFLPGARLPSQHQLSNHYGVARETVKRALTILAQQDLVVTRQGQGSFVRIRAIETNRWKEEAIAAMERFLVEDPEGYADYMRELKR